MHGFVEINTARFDCFKECNWECPCYKCDTWRKHREADVIMMQQIQEHQGNEIIKFWGIQSSLHKSAQEYN